MFIFSANQFYYMTVVLSNCTYNGSVFLTDTNLFALEKTLRDGFSNVLGLDFRGIGSSMVRGSVNSLTLGFAAGYYNQKQHLQYNNASDLNFAIKSALSNIPGLGFSELRTEVAFLGRSNV